MSMTLSYLDENFEQKFCTLACAPFDEKHDSNHILMQLTSMISEWNLANKIVCVIRDSDAKLIKVHGNQFSYIYGF